MIIDFHTHCFPDDIAQKALPGLAKSWGEGQPHHNGTSGGLYEYMEKNGINISVQLPIATNSMKSSESMNVFAASLNNTKGFVCFGSVHPFFPGWKKDLDRVCELGLYGIKLHPDYQGFFIDDPESVELIRECGKRGLPVIVHGGLDVAFPDTQHCTPQRVINILPEISEVKLIVAHLGGMRYLDDVLYKLLPNRTDDLYLDTSYTLTREDPVKCGAILRSWPADRLLYGSDSPWSAAKKDFEALRALNMPSEWYDGVFYKNAQRLLGL